MVEMNQENASSEFLHGLDSFKRQSFRRIKIISQIARAIINQRRGLIGIFIVSVIFICAIFAPWIAPYDPYEQDIPNRFSGPTIEHLLGTDYVGRDILSRLIYGARVAVIVSILSVGIAILIGGPLGVIGAYFGGMVDAIILTIFDVIRSFPTIIVILVLAAIVGPSLRNIILILAFTTFPAYGRIVRAQALSIKEDEYIMAARSIGASANRIVFNHISPNILTPVIVLAGMDLAVIITWEAALSFLGLGLPPPAASWGVMLRQGYTYINKAPLMIVWPAIALIAAMIGFSLFAEALRVALNPRERKADD
jgi:ABC-type dipeptide/oligopeptide/nickel transport system permease subunit